MDYVETIKDEKIKKAVKTALSRLGYKMKFCPASFTGKHHPKDECGKEGLRKHIEKICWFIDKACMVYKYSDEVRDWLIASAYFHDLSKVEKAKVVEKVIYKGNKIERVAEVSRELSTEGDKHPFESSILAKKYLEEARVDNTSIGVICNIIISHMSHWYPDYPVPSTEYEKLFALADFIVSREEFNIVKKGWWRRLLQL